MSFKLNIADWLSLSRILMAPFCLLILSDWQYAVPAMVVLLALAVATDFLDGQLARRLNRKSDLGAFLDFTSDKIFVATMLISLTAKMWVPAWMTALILSREFFVMGIRLFAAAQGFVLSAKLWGKIKTSVTFLALLLTVLQISGAWWVMLAAVLLTVFSGIDYIFKVRKYLLSKKTS